MKNRKWLLALALGVLASGAPVAVSAADVGPGDADNNLTNVGAAYELADDNSTALANSTAEFDLDAGTLALLAVPNLHFESKSVASLIQGTQTFALDTGTIAADSPAFDGNDTKNIKVQDYRGNNAGWQLTANLGEFAGKKAITADAIQLVGTLNGDNVSSVTLSNANFAGTNTPIVSAPVAAGTGLTDVTVDAGSLTLPQDPQALAGTYQGTVNWSLSVVPTPPSP